MSRSRDGTLNASRILRIHAAKVIARGILQDEQTLSISDDMPLLQRDTSY
jgi:hypothetical protein